MQSLYAQSLTQKKGFFMFLAFKLQEWAFLKFFKRLSFYTKCAPFLLTLVIKGAKGFELMKIVFIINLSTFGSNVLLMLKIMDFENVALNKSYSYLCDRGRECIIYIISIQFVVKTYLYPTCSVKHGIQNIKF